MTVTKLSACAVSLAILAFKSLAAGPSLIVVQDLGGASALPYYRSLHLADNSADAPLIDLSHIQTAPASSRYSESDLLPVRSKYLTPGAVARREISVPRLIPIFLVGDDDRSRTWLRQRGEFLLETHATGLVVNVESQHSLDGLRQLVPGLTLAPASGDDLALRLHIRHYPVLITPTRIEQ